MDISNALEEICSRTGVSFQRLAHILGVSHISIDRWKRGASSPSPAQMQRIAILYQAAHDRGNLPQFSESTAFLSTGVRKRSSQLTLFEEQEAFPEVKLSASHLPPIINRLTEGNYYLVDNCSLARILEHNTLPMPTVQESPANGMSAGKNTYTYDAHTYHTKVPPQGIAELVKHYLPEGGLVLDAFAGSGMTGVACRVLGYDCILNELSPAACFIANRFVSFVKPSLFEAGVQTILDELQSLRSRLYTTTCRECGKPTEVLYVVWSYQVICSACEHEFLLWDHCRSYGERVRDHKILKEFPCPECGHVLKKSKLRRTTIEPVQIGYMCCGSRQQEVTHSLNAADLQLIHDLEAHPPLAEGFYPQNELPEGENLQQPVNHGLDRIDRFYTSRNLAAMSHLWEAIHRIEDVNLAAHLAFVSTSLYRRVTRLSEFRFWGGSGNSARLNIPFLFEETNVFLAFTRKARSIQDHLEATASQYSGKAIIVENSATSLDYLPDESVDMIFTDPPFGGNINYSDMNFLWESWLGRFTNTEMEAIINDVQGKDVNDYQRLMTLSLQECHRVLRAGHWMLLVFMNSSNNVWNALRAAIAKAGFEIRQVDIFDKQHGTFKHFVNENAAGCDLVLHCFKPTEARQVDREQNQRRIVPEPPPTEAPDDLMKQALFAFLAEVDASKLTNTFLHVKREQEIDYRKLYSEWTARSIIQGTETLDFPLFRSLVEKWIKGVDLRR